MSKKKPIKKNTIADRTPQIEVGKLYQIPENKSGVKMVSGFVGTAETDTIAEMPINIPAGRAAKSDAVRQARAIRRQLEDNSENADLQQEYHDMFHMSYASLAEAIAEQKAAKAQGDNPVEANTENTYKEALDKVHESLRTIMAPLIVQNRYEDLEVISKFGQFLKALKY